MLYFYIRIRNPFVKAIRHHDVKNFYLKNLKLSKNKSLELQIYKTSFSDDLFCLSLDTNWIGQDHAGPELEMGLFGFQVNLNIYDHRHWNYGQGNWET